MRPEQRRHEIIEMLIREGSVTLEALASCFDVSTMTIHRDLDELESAGLLRKIRGGATIEAGGQFESDFRYRARVAADEKRRIAQRAADFIERRMIVMVDDGSTSQMIAPHLIDKRPLTVITNNLALITGLAGEPGIDLLALGGSFSKKFNGFFGTVAEKAIAELRADVAFLSSSAIDGRTAFHQDQEVLEVKRGMIASSSVHYLMVDHRKFGRTALHRLSDLSVFDGVITSDALPGDKATALMDEGIKLFFAHKD
ncbi:DeoR/GlpR family DNA-binding transcription regulator [Aureimonas frigidaquae]|uniref:Transcriptional regulator of sugar metabolism, deoR family n=1 Tax=Aureimonas frigidaquae TaxID=424757 RepID=A0A0P0Z3G7_9HYPH|nr:DeoR/GlpR family DNA-binding transcription regulator [Aureimonas frigidaquae]BAT28462.1 transcriptional regulator of sugar metabolism, deoR family [Aureimonas frigidaquae]